MMPAGVYSYIDHERLLNEVASGLRLFRSMYGGYMTGGFLQACGVSRQTAEALLEHREVRDWSGMDMLLQGLRVNPDLVRIQVSVVEVHRPDPRFQHSQSRVRMDYGERPLSLVPVERGYAACAQHPFPSFPNPQEAADDYIENHRGHTMFNTINSMINLTIPKRERSDEEYDALYRYPACMACGLYVNTLEEAVTLYLGDHRDHEMQ